jgi:hypothetical protein
MKIYYKRSDASYMFRPLVCPSSGRCVTKNKYIEMLQKLVKQCTCKILNIKNFNFSYLIFYVYVEMLQQVCEAKYV